MLVLGTSPSLAALQEWEFLNRLWCDFLFVRVLCLSGKVSKFSGPSLNAVALSFLLHVCDLVSLSQSVSRVLTRSSFPLSNPVSDPLLFFVWYAAVLYGIIYVSTISTKAEGNDFFLYPKWRLFSTWKNEKPLIPPGDYLVNHKEIFGSVEIGSKTKFNFSRAFY